MTGQLRKTPRRRHWGLTALAALLFLLAITAQVKVDQARMADGPSLLYLPNEKLLTYFTAGLSPVIADFLWLHCIQYVAIENKTERNFTWLENMVFTTVRLDPWFKDAYRYGGIFLSALRADADSASKLLQQGIVQIPQSWELPYEMGALYLLNWREKPNARQYAAYYLSMSGATGAAPPSVLKIVSAINNRNNFNDIEEAMWRDLAKQGDKTLRELAERKLKEVEIRRALQVLEERVTAFREKAGRPPASVDELVQAGLLRYAPPDQLGGKYFLGPDGKPYNTTLLDDAKQRARENILRRMDRFKQQHSRLPASMDEMVSEKIIDDLTAHPYPGQSWKYDPATGVVE